MIELNDKKKIGQKERFTDPELEKILFSKLDIITESDTESEESSSDTNVDWGAWQL